MCQPSDECIENPTALVAEDDAATRQRVAGYLRGKGYGVLEARTSVEALLLAVDFPGRIDALFTSTMLREYCNGHELAECLRAMRPEMAVFYLQDSREPASEVTRDLVLGKVVEIRKPVTVPRLEVALGLIEENRDWAMAASDPLEWNR